MEVRGVRKRVGGRQVSVLDNPSASAQQKADIGLFQHQSAYAEAVKKQQEKKGAYRNLRGYF